MHVGVIQLRAKHASELRPKKAVKVSTGSNCENGVDGGRSLTLVYFDIKSVS